MQINTDAWIDKHERIVKNAFLECNLKSSQRLIHPSRTISYNPLHLPLGTPCNYNNRYNLHPRTNFASHGEQEENSNSLNAMKVLQTLFVLDNIKILKERASTLRAGCFKITHRKIIICVREKNVFQSELLYHLKT